MHTNVAQSIDKRLLCAFPSDNCTCSTSIMFACYFYSHTRISERRAIPPPRGVYGEVEKAEQQKNRASHEKNEGEGYQ